MKKRLLSVALCLALCLGLLPVGVLAEEIVPGEDSNTDYVASVTTSGGESTTSYTSLDDALDAAKDGDTVKLLGDAKITKWRSLTAAITLDLNGKTITTQPKAELYIRAQVIVQDNSTGKNGGMAGTDLLNVQEKGDLIIQSGTFDGKITINVGKLTIKGGTFNQEVDLRGGDSDSVFFSGGTFANIWYPNSSGSFLDLLAAGYAFYDNDGKLVNVAEITGMNLNNVRIWPHQHTFTNGACACGYTCPHTSVDANGACTVCHKQIAASVTAGEDVTYYDGLGKALNYANQNKGCTLKLLANVESAVSVEAPLIFDLNGHNVQRLSVCAKATIRDSGTEKGKIGKVLIFDKEGETPNLTLGDLLEEGYAFKYENDTWVNDSHVQTSDGLSVTVEEAPIKRVVLDAIGADKKEVPTTMAYGTTGAVTLEASCWTAGTNPPTYTWYKLEGAAATAPMEGVNGVKYKLPADLPAGKHTYLVTCTSGGYSKSAEITITVTPISLECAEVTVQNPTYNGDKQSPTLKVSLGGKTLRENTDYTVVITPHTDAGSYTLTINGMGNYTGTATSNWKITPKTVTNPTIKLSSGPFTYTGQKIEPTVTVMDEGKTIPDSEYTVSYESNINAGTAKIIITDKENGNYTVSGNTTFTIDKAAPTYTLPIANNLTYNGTAQELFKAGTTQDGTMLYSMSKTSDFLPNVPLIRKAGTYTFYYQVRGDGNHTDSDIGTITVTIKTAPLTITAKDKSAYVGSTAPDLSNPELNKDYTVSGLFGRDQLTKSPVLSYATEKPDMSQIGSVDINISDADAGRNYTITYVSGKLNITTRSSSSGSSNSGTKTDTVKNPDGSTTKTETKADGSKTETTTASSGGGSTGTTVTKTDAKGNTTTEASAKLSDRDVKEAQEKGEAVSVPVKGIAAAKDANAATKIKIDVPNNANKTTVEIPVENVTSGTVAVIVHEDGTEELVKDSKPTEHGVQLELSGSTTVKIIDNSKTFDDTKDHWSRDEVNFVAARELFNGVGGNQFGVSQPMTRGMVNTVLARLAGVDTTPSQGQAWYEVGTDWAKKNGISDGTNPTAPVTREQLATLLYRYAGSPSVSGTLHAADAASVSDYAEDALLWANQNGIVNGVGSNTIAPKDNAQRAQVAAMLARYLQNQ